MRRGEVWVYRPAEHKMSHAGRDKAVPLSPSAVAILLPWLAGKEPGQVVFSPRQARAEMYARRRKERKSPVQPSQLDRSKPGAARKSGERFTITGYCGYVKRAAKKAGVPNWSPLNLRHSFGTEVRDKFGLEVAQVLLGHKRADVTQVYAAKNLAAGIEAAKAMG
jgi:integrase